MGRGEEAVPNWRTPDLKFSYIKASMTKKNT